MKVFVTDCNRNQYEYIGLLTGWCIQYCLVGVDKSNRDSFIKKMDCNRNQYEYTDVLID